jgi:hypothetical protein
VATPGPATPVPATPVPATPAPATRASRAKVEDKDDALNLGSTVLPILIKSYGKQALIGVVVVVAVVVVWRALSG